MIQRMSICSLSSDRCGLHRLCRAGWRRRAGRHCPPSARILLGLAMPDKHDTELIAQVRGTGLATMPMVLLTTAVRDGIKRRPRIR